MFNLLNKELHYLCTCLNIIFRKSISNSYYIPMNQLIIHLMKQHKICKKKIELDNIIACSNKYDSHWTTWLTLKNNYTNKHIHIWRGYQKKAFWMLSIKYINIRRICIYCVVIILHWIECIFTLHVFQLSHRSQAAGHQSRLCAESWPAKCHRGCWWDFYPNHGPQDKPWHICMPEGVPCNKCTGCCGPQGEVHCYLQCLPLQVFSSNYFILNGE